ncbi:hypothetical protein TFLX_01130 [Thermoflexales bacterium]|nr:hypothetical protein TFLX_01130 [Thermoflexales bacterium]
MSPDIEWRIGEDAEQEIIAHTSHARRSRSGLWAVLIAIGLGVSLGVIYRSIPEPSPTPIVTTPTPTPSAAPTADPRPAVTLSDTIALEAEALARGDRQEFVALQDPVEHIWLQKQSAAFEAWGTPPSGEPLYTIAASETLPNERAWAEVIQYRNGQFFRQLRFYRLAENRSGWLRTPPQPEVVVWGLTPVESNPTEHFIVTSAERDTFAAWEMARQFERLYAEACGAFGCWGLPPIGRYFTLAMLPDVRYASLHTDDLAQHVTITLPSPLILGIYQSRAQNPATGPDDRITAYFDQFVYPWMVYALSGGFERWSKDRNGLILIWAIGEWAQERLGRAPQPTLPRPADIANRLKPLSIDAVWPWPDQLIEDERDLSQVQAKVLVQLIAQHYGPDKVMALFRSIRAADSLSAALEASSLSYADIATLWNDWLKKSVKS